MAPNTPPTTLRAAAVQLNAAEDVDRNLATAERLTRAAAGRGAQLIVLPEKWTVLGRSEVMEEHAQTLDGPAVSWAKDIAKELKVELIAGSFVERRDGQEKTSNTSLHIGPDGEIRAVYRKLHMFDVEVEGTIYAESAREQAGDEVVVTTTGGSAAVGTDGTDRPQGGSDGPGANGPDLRRHLLGMSICYDVRFPELYRALSERGAEILTVPAAFTLATTRDHWELLLRARAVENQCFVIAANQIGEYPPGNRSGGRSMIIDPWGLVLATAPDSESVIVADLDFALLQDVRTRLPALTHRRDPRLYEQQSAAGSI
ncbi:MAG: carbon-nitrogen hydrolase family protein [Acidobacteriota bacterium]|nr:carbon-nitrogen hydrolase family protein [Acidobacteriota bacterium]